MKTLIISHANCVDGFVSAYLMSLIYPDALLIFHRYNTPLDMELIKSLGDIGNIVIVDFSLPFEEIRELNKITKDIVIYDHHESAAKLYANGSYCECLYQKDQCLLKTKLVSISTLPKRAIFTALLVEEKCASKIIYDENTQVIIAALALKLNAISIERSAGCVDPDKDIFVFNDLENCYEFAKDKLETIIEAVDKYDRWQNPDYNVFYVNEFIRVLFEEGMQIIKQCKSNSFSPFEMFTNWIYDLGTTFSRESAEVSKRAYKRVNEREIIVNHYVKRPKIHKFAGYPEIPFVSCPGDMVNYVGLELYKKYPFAFMYYLNTNGTVKISLRADNASGIDLTKIAAPYGGGGHKAASGILMSMDKFWELLEEIKLEELKNEPYNKS